MTNKQALNTLKSIIPDLHNNELVGYLCIKKNITPLKAALAIVLLNLVTSVVLSRATNTWSSTSTDRGFITDYPTWAFEFILHPAIIYACFWLQHSISDVFDSIILKEKIIPPISCLDAIMKCKEKMQGRIIKVIGGIVAIVFGVATILIFTGQNNDSWLTRNFILAWSRGVIYPIIGYAIAICLVDISILYQTLQEIFGESLELKIYHPDGVGGVGAIGKFVANEGYLFLVVGFTSISISVLYDVESLVNLHDFVLVSYLLIYLLLLPILFIMPLLSLHKSMLATRNIKLAKISATFSAVADRLIFGTQDQEEREKLRSRLQELDQIRSLINTMPTWPINFSNVREFFGLSIAPLLPTIIALIKSFFSK